MKHYFIKGISALTTSFLLTGYLMTFAPNAKAETVMRFTAPFISNAGITDAVGDRHFLSINVTGFPLESLLVTLPESMKFEKAIVVGQSGQEIRASQSLEDGTLFFRFENPIQPENSFRVQLTGAETDTPGNRLLYRVAAVQAGLDTPLPLGTAMIRLPDIDL